jgi:hypothetical protein
MVLVYRSVGISVTGPLYRTIDILASQRPGIRVTEIAELLNISYERATRLSHNAVEDMSLEIEFD